MKAGYIREVGCALQRAKLQADPLMDLARLRVRTARCFLDGFAQIREMQGHISLPIFAAMSPTDKVRAASSLLVVYRVKKANYSVQSSLTSVNRDIKSRKKMVRNTFLITSPPEALDFLVCIHVKHDLLFPETIFCMSERVVRAPNLGDSGVA